MGVPPVQGLSLIFIRKECKTTWKIPALHRKLLTVGSLLSPRQDSKLTEKPYFNVSCHSTTSIDMKAAEKYLLLDPVTG